MTQHSPGHRATDPMERTPDMASYRVLLIDDDARLHNLLDSYLSSNDFALGHAHDGHQGLAMVQREVWDAILVDVMMPGMDGPTTFQEFRRIPDLANTPVIFMTAKVQSREIDEYLDLGAAGVITKPFDPVTLCGEIEGLWNAFKG